MELLVWLGGFACVVTFLALAGHGIWLIGAAILRSMSGEQAPGPPDRPRRHSCPGCRAQLLATDRHCPICRLDLGSARANQLDRLRTAQREVRALADREELDPLTAERVAAGLERRVQFLRNGQDERSAAPRPHVEPVGTTAAARPAAQPPLELPPVPAGRPSETPAPRLEPEEPTSAEGAAPPPPDGYGTRRHGVLTAFMEEKNILWGELVGGLLIVGCSIALVVTLWQTLEALPYFPFLLSAGITSALFGAGQYTLHHWKLASTSRGLLVIALLLAPLNLLLLANPGTDGGWADVAVKAAATLVFVGLVRTAGRDLIGTDLLPGPVDRRWLFALAVVGAPATQALSLGREGGSPSALLLWLPLACAGGACATVLGGLSWYRRPGEREHLSERQGSAVLMFVGMSLFALFAAWGWAVARSPDLPATLLALSLPLAVAGVPVVEAGLLVQRRVRDEAGATPGGRHSHLRATGTGVALAGSALLASGVTLAWPDPFWLMLVAALVGAVFTREVWRASLPWFQVGAVPAFGLAAVLAVHGVTGRWAAPDGTSPDRWLWGLLGSSATGITLAAFGLVLAAVGEVAARVGMRPQAPGYALGGVAAGVAGLFLTTVKGVGEPWPAVGVHFGCAAGLLAANVRWRKRAIAEGGLWLVLVGTLWTLWAVAPDARPTWGLVVALEALTFATTALALTPRAARPGPTGVVVTQTRTATADVAVAAGVTAVVLTLSAPGFPHGWFHSTALLALAPTGLLLARVFARPWPTWAGSALALLGLILLATFPAQIRPVTAALLLALLGHATLALAGSLVLRGRRSLVRLFADPLRLSARGTSALAVPFLLVPSAGLGLEWAGFAVWLAAVWFVMTWTWQETGAFSGGHGALAAAAVLCGLAWVERQDWWPTTTLGFSDPRALQAFEFGLGCLGLVWLGARRAVAKNDRLRTLWLSDPFALDRLIVGAVVVVQLLLLAAAIEPALRAELTPLGQPPGPEAPPELASAFGPGAWLVLGVLAAWLVAALRFAADEEPVRDALFLGLAVIAVSVPVAWAGSFGPEVAAASAFRWGLAAAAVLGTAVLVFREPLARLAGAGGFRPGSSLATTGSYVVLAVAAAVVILVTTNVAHLGLTGRKPGGPAEDSVFARMGLTFSVIGPLALVVVGLAASAVRERAAGYAFTAGLVFAGTVTGGYALGVVTGGGSLDGEQQVRLGILVTGSAAAWALLWLAAERRVPGGALLDWQSAFGLAGIGVIALAPLAQLFVSPSRPLHPAFAEFGRFGWAGLILAGLAGFVRAARRTPTLRAHVVGFAAIVAGALVACAVQGWDEPDLCLSFDAMTAAWAVAGIGLAAAVFAAPDLSRGAWMTGVAVGLALAAIIRPAPLIGSWVVPLALAGYALLSSGNVVVFARRAAERVRQEAARWSWVIAAETVVGSVAILLAIGETVGGEQVAERLAGPLAVLLIALAAGLLAGSAPTGLDSLPRFAAVVTAAVGLGLVGWAVPAPNSPAVWLQRNGWALIALLAAALTYLEAVPRVYAGPGWVAAARRAGGWLVVASLGTLVVVFLHQVIVFDPKTRHTPLDLPEVLAILAAVSVLIVLLLRFALRPAADPFALSRARRTEYVYLAELLLVLFFVHVRLNLPELFLPQAVRYWTFLVMLLAFVGIGLAELFERRGVPVLAGPLRRTGVLLPLIPLLAFWAKPPAFLLEFADDRAPGARPLLGYLEKLPQHFDSYAGLWFLAGLLYGLVALSRRSFGWALLAALAANAGMWALLTHNDISAAVHPQIWVIPLALIVLVSEHVNRRDLRPDVSAGLRYLGIGMLYVSSAADMFLAGAGQSLWLPVVLAVLCVAGIFAGIMLRVQAFLFLGIGFLLLDVFAMIWHAAVDRAQTWVWYASGIVLGAAILALFALFEKRRNDVVGVVERIRRWD